MNFPRKSAFTLLFIFGVTAVLAAPGVGKSSKTSDPRLAELLGRNPQDYPSKKRLVEESLAYATLLEGRRQFRSAEQLLRRNLRIWPNHPETLERLKPFSRMRVIEDEPRKRAPTRPERTRPRVRSQESPQENVTIAKTGRTPGTVTATKKPQTAKPAARARRARTETSRALPNRSLPAPVTSAPPVANAAQATVADPNSSGQVHPASEPKVIDPKASVPPVEPKPQAELTPAPAVDSDKRSEKVEPTDKQKSGGFLDLLEQYQTPVVVGATLIMALLLFVELIRLILSLLQRYRARSYSASADRQTSGRRETGAADRSPETTIEAMALEGEELAARSAGSGLASLKHIGAFLDRRTNRPGHSQNVARIAAFVARKMGFDEAYVADLRLAALVMDLGLIDLPSSLFRSAESLSTKELVIVQQHTLRSVALLEGYTLPTRVLNAVRHHHERWDGSGYPTGLAGREIPLEARILAVADAFAAMTQFRAHRVTFSRGAALKQMMNEADHAFDRGVVSALYGAAVEKVMALRHESQRAHGA